jgi:hypothetical protein
VVQALACGWQAERQSTNNAMCNFSSKELTGHNPLM